MSGAPVKRTHEEGVYSSSSKYPPHEDTGSNPKLTSGVSNEYHPPYEMGPDARVAKISRTESREADRRSPLHSMYRMLPSSNESHMDSHSNVAPESRLESRDSKDSRDHRIENRDPRTDAREVYGEVKRDSQSVKNEKDVRFDSRGDDIKEVKHDREAHIDPKNDMKMEKDGFGAASSQVSWKESKEHHRGKRYLESPGGHVDPWHISRGNSQAPVEIGKESTNIEERDHVEAHEAVGENKVDSKGEDRFKEKDRKRKDLKHREWGDRDKERSDRRGNMQVGNSSAEGKESVKEEREAERWERERKDLSKDRERLKEREKDHIKRESGAGAEKESSHNEKESADGTVKISEQEKPILEPKKQKDFDNWKNVDREAKDRKKEREADIEGDRPEKGSRMNGKESDDGFVDGERNSEREKEGVNYGGQQRKRMLRPRGSPQVANREPRFRSHAQETEGCQGKSEVSSVVYKVGECMQELIKLWKEYESSQSDKNGESSHKGPTLEIRIPAEHVTATNRQVRGGQLWGTDIYTDDSDLVAVLMHTGYCRPTASPPPPAIQELCATIRVLPPQDSYTSMLRNNVRSRAWGAGIGCSYRVERCCIVKKGGGTIDLEPCLTHTSAVEPTLAPVVVERTMTTRAAASNALRQQRFVREVTIQYNLCNEPWIKYSISIVADKGLKKPLYTSARLKKGEVLYLETHSCRYELCFTGEKMVKATQASQVHEETEKSHNHHPHSSNGEKNDSDNVLIDVFRWSRCKKPLPQKVMRSVGIPLPLEHVEVLEENLDWEDVQWSQTGVWIAGKEYALARVHFLSPS
ncbi:hypothetical protein OIU85_027966 [Salix viminalis]|uniref:Histone deacetylation protein Rxt3 n=1 Tax=Salix viminalis TaxID=40686 RepID=A0A9Q0QJ55_SALVM|nr:hypothetical protein OIU85_027966 [Salix viminalis]KAJ6707652.1 hypothetical protein OIU85_027966 [Salix viminalis]